MKQMVVLISLRPRGRTRKAPWVVEITDFNAAGMKKRQTLRCETLDDAKRIAERARRYAVHEGIRFEVSVLHDADLRWIPIG